MREDSIILDAGWPKLDFIVTKHPKKMILRLKKHFEANMSLFSENQSDRSYLTKIYSEARWCHSRPDFCTR